MSPLIQSIASCEPWPTVSVGGREANRGRLFRLFARQSAVKFHDRRSLFPFFDVFAVVDHFFCFSVTTTSFLFRIFAHP